MLYFYHDKKTAFHVGCHVCSRQPCPDWLPSISARPGDRCATCQRVCDSENRPYRQRWLGDLLRDTLGNDQRVWHHIGHHRRCRHVCPDGLVPAATVDFGNGRGCRYRQEPAEYAKRTGLLTKEKLCSKSWTCSTYYDDGTITLTFSQSGTATYYNSYRQSSESFSYEIDGNTVILYSYAQDAQLIVAHYLPQRDAFVAIDYDNKLFQ